MSFKSFSNTSDAKKPEVSAATPKAAETAKPVMDLKAAPAKKA